LCLSDDEADLGYWITYELPWLCDAGYCLCIVEMDEGCWKLLTMFIRVLEGILEEKGFLIPSLGLPISVCVCVGVSAAPFSNDWETI
jgi:hypothetical protein